MLTKKSISTANYPWEVKTFSNKQKLRDFVTSHIFATSILEGHLQAEIKGY